MKRSSRPRPIRAATLAVILLALLALAACGGSGGQAAGTATPAPSTSSARWDYVVLGDSALQSPDGSSTVADAQARLIKRDVGADVKVKWYYYPGTTSARILYELRYNDSLRDAIRSAELVLFDVPVGALKNAVPFDWEAYQPLPGSPERFRKGMAEMLPGYERDARAIVKEIVALRGTSEASIRTIDLWQLGYPGFRELGVGSVMRDAWIRMNEAVNEAGKAQGVAVVDAYSAFMGPDGRTDPVAAGDILPDQMHLTDRGITRLAELLHQAGYAEIAPSQ